MSNSCSVSLTEAIENLSSWPWIIAHRGDWSSLPENSTEAMLSAIVKGADMVEIDTQSTADGTLVVIHDDHLDRTTDASGPVKQLKTNEIEHISLKSGGGGDLAALTRSRLPTLANLLEAARGKALINLDTKHQVDLDAVANLVLEMGMEDQVLLKMSIDPVTIGSEILNAPWFDKVHFMPIIVDAKPGELVEQVIAAAETFKPRIFEIQIHDEGELKTLNAQNFHLWINTLDLFHPLDYSDGKALIRPDEVWGSLLDKGVRAIQTDQTRKLADYLGR